MQNRILPMYVYSFILAYSLFFYKKSDAAIFLNYTQNSRNENTTTPDNISLGINPVRELLDTTAINSRIQEPQEEENTIDRSIYKHEQDQKDENTQELQQEIHKQNQEEVLDKTAINSRIQEFQEEENTIDRSIDKHEQDQKDENTQKLQHEIIQINREEVLDKTAINSRIQEPQEEENTIDRSIDKHEQDQKDENTQKLQQEIHKQNQNLQITKSKIYEEKGIIFILYYVISHFYIFVYF